jgi:hypothetical protein
MSWLRSRLRAWLGINDDFILADRRMDKWAERIIAAERELESFKSALKARAAESRQKPAYTDFESSQQAVLAEFEEKNGVRS